MYLIYLKLRVQDDDLSGCAYPELVPLLLDPSLAHYGELVDRRANRGCARKDLHIHTLI